MLLLQILLHFSFLFAFTSGGIALRENDFARARDTRAEVYLQLDAKGSRQLEQLMSVANNGLVEISARGEESAMDAMILTEKLLQFLNQSLAEIDMHGREIARYGPTRNVSRRPFRIVWPPRVISMLASIAQLQLRHGNDLAFPHGDRHIHDALHLAHDIFHHSHAGSIEQIASLEMASQLFILLRQFCKGVNMYKKFSEHC